MPKKETEPEKLARQVQNEFAELRKEMATKADLESLRTEVATKQDLHDLHTDVLDAIGLLKHEVLKVTVLSVDLHRLEERVSRLEKQAGI